MNPETLAKINEIYKNRMYLLEIIRKLVSKWKLTQPTLNFMWTDIDITTHWIKKNGQIIVLPRYFFH